MFSGMMDQMESSAQPFRISPHKRPRHMWLQVLLSIIGAVILAFLLNLFVFQSYYVDGESMSPTLHTNDRLVISKVERSWSLMKRETYIPVRGQIVVIDGSISPSTAARAPHLIKRVVGIPGDTLKFRNGSVTLYNAQYPEGTDLNSLFGLSLDATFVNQDQTVIVPDNSVFVMGDNRKEGGSYDSRAFGPVPTDLIVGRLWMRILPLNHERVF